MRVSLFPVFTDSQTLSVSTVTQEELEAHRDLCWYLTINLLPKNALPNFLLSVSMLVVEYLFSIEPKGDSKVDDYFV